MTQVPLSGTEAAVIGVGAFIAVTLDLGWALIQYGQVLAHEGAHGVIGSLFFLRVTGVTIDTGSSGATGATGVQTAPSVRGHLFFFIGYLGPSLFGLGAARLIESGYILAVLWVTVILLGVLLIRVVTFFGQFVVVLVGGLVYAVGHYTPASVQVIGAYAITWLLLLAGARRAIERGVRAKDAEILRGRTGIPMLIWALVWMAGTLGAVALGGRMLVLHH